MQQLCFHLRCRNNGCQHFSKFIAKLRNNPLFLHLSWGSVHICLYADFTEGHTFSLLVAICGFHLGTIGRSTVVSHSCVRCSPTDRVRRALHRVGSRTLLAVCFLVSSVDSIQLGPLDSRRAARSIGVVGWLCASSPRGVALRGI